MNALIPFPGADSSGPVADVPGNLPAGGDDLREQLFNAGAVGKITEIQVSYARVYQVRGLLFDLDPLLLQPSLLLGNGRIEGDPEKFFTTNLLPLLERHPLLRHLEVRLSGTGLHAILWLVPPAACGTDAEREDIATVADVITRLLPTDPYQPGLTAVTRALGSRNTKNGATVRQLRVGTPVPYSEVRAAAVQVVAQPLRSICDVLFGSDQVSPCPVCRKENSRLSVQPHVGTCYLCGRVNLETLWESIYITKKESEKEVENV